MASPKLLRSEQFIQALLDAGAISVEDNASRVVIDVQAGSFVKLYVERIGDERLIEVAMKAALDVTEKEPAQ